MLKKQWKLLINQWINKIIPWTIIKKSDIYKYKELVNELERTGNFIKYFGVDEEAMTDPEYKIKYLVKDLFKDKYLNK